MRTPHTHSHGLERTNMLTITLNACEYVGEEVGTGRGIFTDRKHGRRYRGEFNAENRAQGYGVVQLGHSLQHISGQFADGLSHGYSVGRRANENHIQYSLCTTRASTKTGVTSSTVSRAMVYSAGSLDGVLGERRSPTSSGRRWTRRCAVALPHGDRPLGTHTGSCYARDRRGQSKSLPRSSSRFRRVA